MLHILFRGNLAKNGLLTQISHQKLRNDAKKDKKGEISQSEIKSLAKKDEI